MYKVIIVEDELLVRKGLLRTIDWASYNMDVIADVVNGKLALDLYYEKNPDIIITDLQMPVMDGITLIEKIRENDRQTIIIILSCHDEFELIRKAISLSVSDYIFKLTMTEEETDNILRKTQLELDKRTRSIEMPVSHFVSNDYIKEIFLKDYIFYKKYTEDEFREKVKEYKLNLNDDSFLISVMEIDVSVLNGYDREKKHNFMLTILDIIKGISDADGEVFYDCDNRYILLINNSLGLSQKEFYEHVTLYLIKISKIIYDTYKTTVSVGVSNIQRGFSFMNSMFDQAQNMLAHAFIMGADIYLSSDDLQAEMTYKERISDLCDFLESNKLLFEISYERSNTIVDELKEINCFDKKNIINKFIQLFQWSATFFDVENKNTRDWVIGYTENIRECPTLEKIITIYKNAIFEIAETCNKQRVLGNAILRATQYMNNNYNEILSLQIVADDLSISPVYLSHLFKKKLGINFIDYLNKLRVENAKKLLKTSSLRTYEIADQVGFSDTTYFSKTFKKYTNLSPSSYRKHLELDVKTKENI